MTVSLAGLSIPAPDAIALDDIIAMYEALRPHMPPAVPPPAPTRQVDRLVDMLPHVDALILDGFGVINVGAGVIDGIHDVLEVAAAWPPPSQHATHRWFQSTSIPSPLLAYLLLGFQLILSQLPNSDTRLPRAQLPRS